MASLRYPSLPRHAFLLIFLWTCVCLSSGQQQYFRVKPQSNVEVIQGSTLNINCAVGGQSGSVQWSKNGFVLGKFCLKSIRMHWNASLDLLNLLPTRVYWVNVNPDPFPCVVAPEHFQVKHQFLVPLVLSAFFFQLLLLWIMCIPFLSCRGLVGSSVCHVSYTKQPPHETLMHLDNTF